jgi:cell wall-associated NlpC family hydrolase
MTAKVITAAEVAAMLAFMVAQIGKPYSEAVPGRFGPNEFDCSGLVFTAAAKAGIPFPGNSATDSGDVLANTEANYLGTLPGVTKITSPSQIKTGDVLFFTGAAPGPSNYGPIGHVGMAYNSTTLISAYDTADGITKTPISQDQFVVGFRLTGGNVSTPSGGGSSPSGGGSGGISIDWGSLPGDFQDFDKVIKYMLAPTTYVRLVAFVAGAAILLFAIHALIAVGKGEPLISMPSTIPVPV